MQTSLQCFLDQRSKDTIIDELPNAQDATPHGHRDCANEEGVTMSKQKMPQPPRHGRVISSAGQHSMPVKHLQQHLSELTAHVHEAAQYSGYEVTGQSSQGGFATGGASGADYQTSSADSVRDADSGGPSGL
jgi:hypothetical protein